MCFFFAPSPPPVARPPPILSHPPHHTYPSLFTNLGVHGLGDAPRLQRHAHCLGRHALRHLVFLGCWFVLVLVGSGSCWCTHMGLCWCWGSFIVYFGGGGRILPENPPIQHQTPNKPPNPSNATQYSTMQSTDPPTHPNGLGVQVGFDEGETPRGRAQQADVGAVLLVCCGVCGCPCL